MIINNVGHIRVPTFYGYGAHDEIIPRHAAFDAAHRLKGADQTAYYANGYHLLMRDHEAPVVWRDVLSFVRDPSAPLPSGAPPIPGAPRLTKASSGEAGG